MKIGINQIHTKDNFICQIYSEMYTWWFKFGRLDLKISACFWRHLRLLRVLEPESADDSRRLRNEDPADSPAVVLDLPHGRDLARSARVSRRHSWEFLLRKDLPEPEPPHSRRMSVSWAKLDRRRRVVPEAGGDVSWSFNKNSNNYFHKWNTPACPFYLS